MRLILSGLCVFILSGCATYHAEPLSATETLESFQARSLDQPELREFLEANLRSSMKDWPLKKWDFDLLTLAAFFYHPDLDIARAQWKIANGAILTAGERPNPNLGFTPEYKASGSSAISPWLYGFTFDIPIETMGKRGRRIDQARHHAESMQSNIAITAWQVRSRLRTALVRYETAKKNAEILKEELSLQQSYVRFLESDQSVASVSLPDRLQAEIGLHQNQMGLADAERQVEEAKVQVAESLAVPVSGLDTDKIVWDRRPELGLSESEIRELALTKRPDLVGALAEYAASQSALQLEIARQYPDLHIGPGYTWDQGQNKWSAGVTLTLPVLNHNQGPIAEARARREESRARFVVLQEKIIFETERALAGYKSALGKWKTARQLLETQRHQNHLLKSQLGTGETSRLALLNSQLALKTTELSYSDAEANLNLAFGALEDAMMAPLLVQSDES